MNSLNLTYKQDPAGWELCSVSETQPEPVLLQSQCHSLRVKNISLFYHMYKFTQFWHTIYIQQGKSCVLLQGLDQSLCSFRANAISWKCKLLAWFATSIKHQFDIPLIFSWVRVVFWFSNSARACAPSGPMPLSGSVISLICHKH